MIRTGDTIHNPVTGERIAFHETVADTNGERVVFEYTVQPDGFVAAAHVHPSQSERFEVIDGNARHQARQGEADARPRRGRRRRARTPHRVLERRRGRGALRLRGAAGAAVRVAARDDVHARGGRQDEPQGHAEPVAARRDRAALTSTRCGSAAARVAAGAGLALGAPLGRALGYRSTYTPASERSRNPRSLRGRGASTSRSGAGADPAGAPGLRGQGGKAGSRARHCGSRNETSAVQQPPRPLRRFSAERTACRRAPSGSPASRHIVIAARVVADVRVTERLKLHTGRDRVLAVRTRAVDDDLRAAIRDTPRDHVGIEARRRHVDRSRQTGVRVHHRRERVDEHERLSVFELAQQLVCRDPGNRHRASILPVAARRAGAVSRTSIRRARPFGQPSRPQAT